MSMHGAMGPVWRHMRTDRSAVSNRVARDTIKRVLKFAGPHRRLIAVFLVLTVLDAALVVVNPLLVKRLIDHGITPGNIDVVVTVAAVMAVVAIIDALLTVGSGYLSAQIGESLILDLRTAVFAHVQRLSLAFFTRTQTGALVSRLNNDVMGAQRAFTSTLSSTVCSGCPGRAYPEVWSTATRLGFLERSAFIALTTSGRVGRSRSVRARPTKLLAGVSGRTPDPSKLML